MTSRNPNDAVHIYVNEFTSSLVAETGNPSDMYHLGKIILKGLKDTPDMVLQIDGGTGQSETSGQCLKRTVKCAISLKNMGLKTGDVMVLMAPNHIDLTVPFYAALTLGIAISPVDKDLKVSELQHTFEVTKPKIIFCQLEKLKDVRKVLRNLSFDATIVIFDKGDDDGCSFKEFLDQANDDEITEFRPADFDPAETFAILIPTSGTTGPPKCAATTHKNFAVTVPYFWNRFTQIPPVRNSLILSPIQWLSAIIHNISSPYMKFTRIQTSSPVTTVHTHYLINKYKPQFMLLSPTFMTTLMKSGDGNKCDYTCFDVIELGGSAVHKDLLDHIKKVSPDTEVINVYGMSEQSSISFVPGYSSPPWSCGKPHQCFQVKLIDIETGRIINKPNIPGEMYIKGPGIFKGYYNNPKATKEVLNEDGWFQTGDIFYRDENWNFYFVDRIKLLLKYRNHQISPVEIESVIRQHPGVLDVAVTGIPDYECGDLPVACVVIRPGHTVTAQEIKDLVKASLVETKQLRGGVVFLDELPMTSSAKIQRRALREIALTSKRE